MRLIEEKYLILAEIFLLIGITLTTLVLQYSNNRIENYNYKILESRSQISQLENLLGLSYLDTIRIDIVRLNENLSLKRIENITQEQNQNEFLKDLNNKFISGKISQDLFLKELRRYLADRMAKLENERSSEYKNFKILLDNKPYCFKYFDCKTLINYSYIFQLVSIILALIIYYFIYTSISNRT